MWRYQHRWGEPSTASKLLKLEHHISHPARAKQLPAACPGPCCWLQHHPDVGQTHPKLLFMPCWAAYSFSKQGNFKFSYIFMTYPGNKTHRKRRWLLKSLLGKVISFLKWHFIQNEIVYLFLHSNISEPSLKIILYQCQKPYKITLKQLH